MSKNKKIIQMNGNSVYFTNQYLLAGKYLFLINAPFNTQMLVSPVNPVPGLRFVDQDATPNIFNAILTVPQDGQYGFKITLDKAVSEGNLEIDFIFQEGGTAASGQNNANSGTKLWNRPDVQDFIDAWLLKNKRNKWGYPAVGTQLTPPGYLSGKYDNRYHWVYLVDASLRDAIRQRFPQYSK